MIHARNVTVIAFEPAHVWKHTRGLKLAIEMIAVAQGACGLSDDRHLLLLESRAALTELLLLMQENA